MRTSRPPATVVDFQGDYDELAAVMEASWAGNESTPFLYEPAFLADCFRYPEATFELAPAIYRDSKLAAFAAGFPRRVNMGGSEYRILISALLTVAEEFKSSGYGIVVWSELMRRAAAAGFDGVINYCVEGEAMHRMILGACARLRLPVGPIASFSYLSRIIWPKEGRSTGEDEPVEVERFCRAASTRAGRLALERRWSGAEAAWQLSRHGAVAVSGGRADQPAVLAGYVMPVADRRSTPCLVVEDVLWDGLDLDGRVDLAAQFVARASRAGARLAIAPVRGDYDPEPMLACGFRPSQKRIHSYLTLFAGELPEGPVASYYLDVF